MQAEEGYPESSGTVGAADHVRTLEAWKEMQRTGKIRRDLLRSHIHRAWSRSYSQGSNPKLMRAIELSPSETTELLERERDLVEAAKPYMFALSKAAGDERHAAMLGDAKGIVLDVIGDEASVHGPERVPGPGALLSEAVAGANGIGTPLAEGGYVEIVGVEHYIEGFHPFTCQGIPLRNDDGSVLGVLSASVRRLEAAQRVREILLCAAHGIEAELLRRRLEREVSITVRSADPKTIEELHQDIVQLQTAARIRIDAAARKARNDSSADVLSLVRVADQLIAEFRTRAKLWEDLASNELGTAQPFKLNELVAKMVRLLETEAKLMGVTLTYEGGRAEPVVFAFADVREFSRRLLRALLDATANKRNGHAVTASVFAEDDSAWAVISSPARELMRLEAPLAGLSSS